MNGEAAVGSTVKKKFFTALLAGLFLFGMLIATFGFTGTIFAVPLGGMGDFYVAFDKLEGEGFTLNPNIGETGNQDTAPLVRNKMDTATIENLHIYKDLKLPGGGGIRVNIAASQPAAIEGLIQDARFIDANLSFNDMAIEQSNTSEMSAEDAFKQNWTQNANTVTITDAVIVTDYLFQNMVTLNGAEISLENISEPEQIDYESGNKKSDSGVAAVSSNGGNGDGGGSVLPDTASNIFLPVIIGAVLVISGGILLLIRKIRSNGGTAEKESMTENM